MYEFWAIFFLAFIFIIAYFIGSNKNKKLSIKYAKAIKEFMTPYSEFVGFKSFGYSGFRSLCKLKKDEAFDKIEIAIAFVDRENLMHYPLSFITKDYDRFVCWGFLKNKISSNIEILPKIDRKNYEKIILQKKLKEIIIEENEFKDSFIFLTDNIEFAENFLFKKDIKKDLLNTKNFIKRLSLDKQESSIYLIAELKEESLKPLLNLILNFGKELS